MDDDEILLRRTEEVEALLSYYGECDFKSSLRGTPTPSSSSSYSADVDVGAVAAASAVSSRLDGPWFLRLHCPQPHSNALGHEEVSTSKNNNANEDGGGATLELRLPRDYPVGATPPIPILHMSSSSSSSSASFMDSNTKHQFLRGLQDDYVEGTFVGIHWGERCREFLLEMMASSSRVECGGGGGGGGMSKNNNNNNDTKVDSCDQGGKGDGNTIAFLPYNARFHQPIRHFPSSIVSNSRYQCAIHRTKPFRPPNSGASECMIAHVARVTCMEHVHWTLGRLLLHDKKVAKASHNMFAYRFYCTTPYEEDDGVGSGRGRGGGKSRAPPLLVSDNDDDGEKGSGRKLAALLELCNVTNVLVVVSRWFGGELLGAARFKWIASVAKDGLIQAGLCE